MADVSAWYVFVSFLMSNDNPKSKTNKRATFKQRITGVSGKAYADAADDAARAATTVGALISAVDGLSIVVKDEYGVNFKLLVNPSPTPPDPGDFVFPFEKLVTHYKGGFDNYHVSIPARNEGALTMESDGISVELADGAAVAAFVSAFETVALDEEANVPAIERITISG